jgi:hypothetical protein
VKTIFLASEVEVRFKMRTHKVTLVLCSLAAFVLAGSIRAGEEPPKPEPAKKAWQQLRPDRLIADNALVYLCCPDAANARQVFERTALSGLLAEDEVAAPIAAAFEKLRDAYLKGDGLRTAPELEHRADEIALLKQLWPLLDGQVALAVDAEMVAGSATPRFLLIASMASEDRQRELSLLMEKYRYSQTTNPHTLDSNGHVGAYDICRIENTEMGLHESWAFVENLFVYGQGKRMVEDAVERYSLKNGAGTLALHGGYQNALREVGRDEQNRDALVYLQVDGSALIKNFAPGNDSLKALIAAAAEAQRPHLALGLSASDGTQAALRERILFRPVTGAPAPLGHGALKAATARFAQNDTLFYCATQGKLAEACQVFAQSFSRLLPPGQASLEQRLQGLLGVEKETDLWSKLDIFKGELGLFVSYVPQPAVKFDVQEILEMFQYVAVVEMDRDANEVEFRKLMDRIEGATKQTYVTMPVGSATVHYQKGAAPHEEKDAGGPGVLGLLPNLVAPAQEQGAAPFFLCYAQVDLDEAGAPPRKFLLLADNLNALRKAIMQTRAPRTSLAEDTRFKELAASFRATRRQLAYLDLNKVADIYGSLLPRFINQEAFNKLPAAAIFQAHLFPGALACSPASDGSGFVVETSSPVGALPLLGLAGLTAWPLIINQEKAAVSQEMDAKFKQLGLGLQLYSADFDRFPQQLSELYPNYIKSLTVFEPPFRRNVLKTPQDIDNPALSNLVYVPRRSLQGLGSEILLYEKEPTCLVEKTSEGPQLFYHVVTLDGKKTWLTKQALDLRLGGKVDYVTPLLGSGDQPGAAEAKNKK